MLASILIVEDDARFSAVFANAIRCAPDLRLVGVAADIAEGRDALKTTEPDVLLLDLGLPGGNGIELIRFVEEHLPQCETIVITVLGDHETVLRCIRAGATGYLLKEARDIDIVEPIRQLRSGGSPISPAIARCLLEDIGGRNTRPSRQAPKPILSPQEIKVLRLSAKGYNYDEIGGLLALSHHTIETYVKRIYRKLQVHSKTEAVYEARQLGFVPD
jgi:DNA-binding NarL/FixJ family response regulator